MATEPKERRGELWQHRNSIRAAIVGLPNSGKSGLFNVLTGERASVDDAVFTTVREAHGVAVHNDPRFFWLCEHFAPGLAVPSRVRIVDLPGIVPESCKGAGLGCEVFKKHAAASDVLLLVIRAFDGPNITQCVGDTTNPLRDLDLMLAELVAIDRATVAREWGQMLAFVERKQGGTQMLAEFRSLEKIQNYFKKTKKPLRFGLVSSSTTPNEMLYIFLLFPIICDFFYQNLFRRRTGTTKIWLFSESSNF
jgi:ribosome-binding ATPase YchF (GTP1/OBG family)